MRALSLLLNIILFPAILCVTQSFEFQHLRRRNLFLAAKNSEAIAAHGEDIAVSASKQLVSQEHNPLSQASKDPHGHADASLLNQPAELPPISEHSPGSPHNPLPSHAQSTPSITGGPTLEQAPSAKTFKGRLSSLGKSSTNFFKNTKLKFASTTSDIRKAIVLWFKTSKDRLKTLFSKFFKKNGAQSTERRILKLQKQRKVRPGQLQSVFFDGEVIIPSHPPTQLELEKYRESRDKIAQVMANNIEQPGTDVVWDPKTLAELIAKRLAPPGNPSSLDTQEALKESILLHETYLENIKNQQTTLNSLQPLKEELLDTETSVTLHTMDFIRPLSKAETESLEEVTKALEELDRAEYERKYYPEFKEFIEGFKSRVRFKADEKHVLPIPRDEGRREKAARLKKEREIQFEREKIWRLDKDKIESYFPNPSYGKPTKQFYTNFARARAAQMAQEPGETTHIAITSTSTVNDIVRTLPKDLDLVEEIYRLTMISGFDNILMAIRPQVRHYVQTVVEDRLAEILPTIEEMRSVFESLLKSTQDEDVAWRESMFSRFSPVGMSPEEVYEKLLQAPGPQAQIPHVLKDPSGPAALFSKQDLDVLMEASSNPKAFSEKLSMIKNHIPKRVDTGSEHSITQAIQELFQKKRMEVVIGAVEKQASGESLVNHPFIEELFEKRLIDSTTRTKLHDAGRMTTKEEVKKALGSKAEFKRRLIDKNAESVLEHLLAEESQTMNVVRDAVKRLTDMFHPQLDQKAKSLYLTQDAFLKPNSFREKEAWMVYDQPAIREFLSTPENSKTMVKVFAESYFSPLKEKDRSGMSRLLDELKIPPKETSKESILAEEFPYFDDRLHVIFQRPLVEGDERLKGTSFETLGEDVLAQINKVAQKFYTQQTELEAAALKIQTLRETIERSEETQLAFEVPLLSRILDSVLSH